jgi:CBS domain-containing protein
MVTEAEYKTVGQILGTNTVRIRPRTNAKFVSITLLSSHTPGGPVIDQDGRLLGFISEFDVLKAKPRYVVSESTSVEDAVHMMEKYHVLSLPVLKDGIVLKTVTRHDLLRAWLGADITMDL